MCRKFAEPRSKVRSRFETENDPLLGTESKTEHKTLQCCSKNPGKLKEYVGVLVCKILCGEPITLVEMILTNGLVL